MGRGTLFIDTQLEDFVIAATGDLNVSVAGVMRDGGVSGAGGVWALGHGGGGGWIRY